MIDVWAGTQPDARGIVVDHIVADQEIVHKVGLPPILLGCKLDGYSRQVEQRIVGYNSIAGLARIPRPLRLPIVLLTIAKP